ncbi:MAG TPA: PEGA domain-containing protein [Vicinamibacterales bacterium]
MHDDQANGLDTRVGRLDDSVARLTSEVTSLKLELATMTSALRELRAAQSGRSVPPPAAPAVVEPLVKPSMTPAAVVVLIASGLLSWQLIATPRVDRTVPQVQAAGLSLPSLLPDQPQQPVGTEPPMTPLIRPTIYRGTLTVNADRPGATVFVNHKNMGPAPVKVRNLRAGAHLVWIEHDGYRRWTRVVTVPAERVTRVTADLEPIEIH